MNEDTKHTSEDSATAEPDVHSEPTDTQTPRADEPAPEKRESNAANGTDVCADITDADDFSARYQAEKELDFKKLEQEIEAKRHLDNRSKKRNWWIKTILLLALIAASIVIMFTMTGYVSGEDTLSFSEMIKGASLPMTFAFIGIVIAMMLVTSAEYSYLLRISTGKWHVRTSIKTMFLGKYYDGITPLGTGGQPFQIYYLHKKTIPVGVATALPLVRYIVNTVVFCLCAIVFFIFTGTQGLLDGWGGDWSGNVMLTVAVISMAFNFIVPVMMVFVSLFPRLGKKIIVKIVGFLNKIRIVKHRYPTMKKYVYEVGEYRKSLKLLFTKWYKLIPLVLICLAETVLYVSLPYFALTAIKSSVVAEAPLSLLLQTSCLTMVAFYASAFIPTPGNSGASEAITALVFLAVSGINNVLGWVILLWRFANYYIYIVSGIGINIFEIIRSAVRKKRASKNSI